MTEELPYAPRRKRPLSLWNPLDYLVLLYWVFFFPQAIRCYLERFGGLAADAQRLNAVWRDGVYRRLIFQAMILLGALFIALWLNPPSLISDDLLVSRLLASLLSAVVILTSVVTVVERVQDPAWDVASAVACGVAVVLAANVALFLSENAFSDLSAVAVFACFGIAYAIERGARSGVWLGLAFTAMTSILVFVAFAFLALHMSSSTTLICITIGVISGVAFTAGLCRVDLALLGLLLASLEPSKRLALMIQSASPLPVPGLAVRLSRKLEEDWEGGLKDCRALLRYTFQFIAVTRAIGWVLESTDGAHLLSRVAHWCDLDPGDWNAVRLQSAGLGAGMICTPNTTWSDFTNDQPGGPSGHDKSHSRPLVELRIRIDTPARAACAGFWYLHQCETDLAGKAFARVRELPFGEELHANAVALTAAVGFQTFDGVGGWLPPALPGPEPLRPAMARTLGRLGQVAQDAHLVLHSRSPRERNGALNRAIGALKYLQGNLDACPQPERAVVEKIVNQWLDLALGVATDVGTLEAREPIASPYIVGAPVPADRLVGRESVYEQIRSAWVKTGQRDSLVVYGHRRMGKTSVMKNLLDFCPMGEDTGLAFLNLQTVDWSEPLPDLCQAIAFELWRAAGSDRPEPQPDAFASNPLAALRTFLAGLNAAPPQRRFILVLDEYELLDERLPPEAGTRFVELLRGLTQQYPWLVIALVGLHSLKERSASFYQAIFAWRPVRIGFLDVGGLADCLEVQDDAFPLAYDPEAVAAVHRLTGGQPFLVQLLGDGLVQGFNRRLREEIRPPASRFTAADVAALTETGDLFTQGAAYFLGIWGQAGVGAPGQQGVLRALAPSADGLDAAGLAQASGLGEADLAAALRALVDHDVLAHRGGRWGFTVELMRRWVAAGQMDLEPGAPA